MCNAHKQHTHNAYVMQTLNHAHIQLKTSFLQTGQSVLVTLFTSSLLFFFSFNAENDVEFRCLHIEKRTNNKRCFFHVNYIVPSKIHPQKESKLLKAEISQFYIAELIGIKGRLINSLFCRKITWLYLECLSRICCNAMWFYHILLRHTEFHYITLFYLSVGDSEEERCKATWLVHSRQRLLSFYSRSHPSSPSPLFPCATLQFFQEKL